MYFEIYQSPSGGLFGQTNALAPKQWRWRLKAANHEIVAQGEGYHNKADCEHAVRLLKSTGMMTQVKMV